MPEPTGVAASASTEIAQHRVRFDRTINIPTLMAIVGGIFSMMFAVNGLYRELEGRITNVEYKIEASKRDIDLNARNQMTFRNDQSVQNTALRNELKSDLRELRLSMEQRWLTEDRRRVK